MEVVNKTLFLLSDGMLVPVMVLLIFFFIKSLFMIGGFFGLAVRRIKKSAERKKHLEHLVTEEDPVQYCKKMCAGNTLFDTTVNQLISHIGQGSTSEKILADAEIRTHKECDQPRMLMRVGPMLGLMGTIIPMGPALTGLASGNLSAMALNMQIAFATTVIGLFCGITGFVLFSVMKRWFAEDMVNCNYVYEVLHGKK
ncbi:MotA/TolQ/ExbB proton channel family domain protein [Chitinispirillum alkaliphilum]|nr:MotA/TolQ/ExbB proton channel family domain protein [Chitinispirillum alkaliphilum]